MEKIKRTIKDGTLFTAKQILIPVLVITLIVGLSFIFFGPFSSLAYSDRMFYTGLIFMTLGAVVIFAQMITGRGMELFFSNTGFRRDAKRAYDPSPESRQEIEKRYNRGGQIWFIGFGCILAGIIVSFIIP
jgi:hypothetical protein